MSESEKGNRVVVVDTEGKVQRVRTEKEIVDENDALEQSLKSKPEGPKKVDLSAVLKEKEERRKQEKEEVKEEVKVFKTDSGEEIVERRKGNRVVLRKKKKQIVQEEEIKEQLQPVDQPPDIKEKIENQETQEVSINTPSNITPSLTLN